MVRSSKAGKGVGLDLVQPADRRDKTTILEEISQDLVMMMIGDFMSYSRSGFSALQKMQML